MAEVLAMPPGEVALFGFFPVGFVEEDMTGEFRGGGETDLQR